MAPIEPDPQVSNQIKAAAARLAEQVVDLVDDGKQLLSDLKSTIIDVKDVCEPPDFANLVVQHLPEKLQSMFADADLSMLLRLAEHTDLMAGFFTNPMVAVRESGPSSGQWPPPPLSFALPPGPRELRAARILSLVNELLARDVGTTKDEAGKTWAMCQIVLQGGFKSAGAIRIHENGLYVFLMEGRNDKGQSASLELYIDVEEIVTIMVPVMATPKSSIVSG